MSQDQHYLLGHDQSEWERLEAQHTLWRDILLGALPPLAPDATVLEPGCGSGALLAELAARVPGGAAIGLERDHTATALLQQRFEGARNVRIVEGDLRRVPLPSPVDMIVCRWVLSFLPDPDVQIARFAAALRPGGALVVQDYLHDAFRTYPPRPEIDIAVDGFRAWFRDIGGDLWIAGRLPELYARAGLQVSEVRPHIRAGLPGSAPFQWVERFMMQHIGQVVAAGHLTPRQRDDFVAAWAETRRTPGAVQFTPVQVVVIGTRPG